MSLRKYQSAVTMVAVVMALFVTLPKAFSQDSSPAKTEVFGGYAYLDPKGQVGATKIKEMPKGFGLATSYFFSKNWGVTFDGGGHFSNQATIGTFMVGPQFRWPGEHVTPFANVMGGWHHINTGIEGNSKFGLTTGGGLDLNTPNKHWGFRLIEASYQLAQHNILAVPTRNSGIRLRTGVVYKWGEFGPPPPPPSASCSAQPSEVFEGEPVTMTASPSNFNPKRTLSYSWTGTGVTVAGTNPTVNVDTKGLQPGTYSGKAHISDGKKGAADCTASFSVKQPRPPVISCSSNPSTVQPNGSSTITSRANSPDGRSLSYSYSSSAGNISGDGSTARLTTSGVNPGTINVTCNVKDDRNLSATSGTSVTIEAPPPPPPPPPVPQASRLNQIMFKKNSARVDNTAKAILDDVALRLQRNADARIIIVGSNDATEKAKGLAAERAVNTKAYLVKEKGIDPSRIDVRSSANQGMTSIIWWVPAGAAAPTAGSDAVKEKPMAPAKKK